MSVIDTPRSLLLQSCLAAALLVLCFPFSGIAQQQMQMNDSIFNFGTIAEEKGSVTHLFSFLNSGDKPLVVSRVSADCGCTMPQWPEEAVEAGSGGEITVHFNPTGRPGPFVKHIYVYASDREAPYRLTIKGNVTTLGGAERGAWAYKIGDIELSSDKLIFPLVPAGMAAGMRLLAINRGKVAVKLEAKQIPDFTQLQKKEYLLPPNEPQDIYINLRTGDLDYTPGIYKAPLTFKCTGVAGTYDISVEIRAVLADKPSPDDDKMSPVMNLKTYFDLGTLPPLPEKVSVDVTLENCGKSPLIIRGIDIDNPALELRRHQRNLTIAPLQKTTLRFHVLQNVMRKNGWRAINTNVSILCNDPGAPLRKVKIKAALSE